MSEKEKRSRFGRLLQKGRERDSGVPGPPPDPTPIPPAESAPGPPPDSAYASSGTPNVSQTSDISRLDNEGKLDAVQRDSNLAVRPTGNTTGDVIAKDTGDVVTTVTTTTTTTTTTTSKGGRKEKEQVKEEVKRHPPVTNTSSTSNRDSVVDGYTELSGNATPPEHPTSAESPPVPPKSTMRRSAELQRPPQSAPAARTTPPPSPSRMGGGPNFSYPKRAAPEPSGQNFPVQQQPQPQPQPQSTMQSLKAAAHGLHGAGETLRGTLNSNIDRRFPLSKDVDKNAATVQRHNDVAHRGMAEIESAQFTSRQGQPVPPPPPQPERFHDGDVHMGGTARNDALSDIPEASQESFASTVTPTPETQAEAEKKNRWSGLLRRKPVPTADEAAMGGAGNRSKVRRRY